MVEPVYIALCTCTSGAAAQELAEALVSRRLAACVNVLAGIRSTYRWQGAVERDEEDLLLIKTSGRRLAELKAWIAEHHPYDVPELLALPIAEGLDPYLEWVTAAVADANS